jgi:hypothetical protein
MMLQVSSKRTVACCRVYVVNVPPHLGVPSVTVLRDPKKSSSSADKSFGDRSPCQVIKLMDNICATLLAFKLKLMIS